MSEKVITLDRDGEIQELSDFWMFTPEAAVLMALYLRYPFAVIVRENSK